jgi:hypothetical protein
MFALSSYLTENTIGFNYNNQKGNYYYYYYYYYYYKLN